MIAEILRLSELFHQNFVLKQCPTRSLHAPLRINGISPLFSINPDHSMEYHTLNDHDEKEMNATDISLNIVKCG